MSWRFPQTGEKHAANFGREAVYQGIAHEPSRFVQRAKPFVSFQSFFPRARKISYGTALINLKGTGDKAVRTENTTCACRLAVGGPVAQVWEIADMTTPTKLLVFVLVGGSIALFSTSVHAGLSSSPFGVQGPVCKGLATSPLGVISTECRGIATSPLGVQGRSPQGIRPPVQDGPGNGPWGVAPAGAPRNEEPRTFEEYLEMMFGNGAW